jgi:AraC-like DNA-binding protein
MDFEFSKTADPVKTSALSLNTIFYVNADTSYDVTKNIESDNKEYIALKTISGKGRLIFQGGERKTVTADTLIIFEYSKIKRYYCPEGIWDFYWLNFSVFTSVFFPLNEVAEVFGPENEQIMLKNCLTFLRSEQNYSKALASSFFSILLYSWLYTLKYEKHTSKLHYSSINKVIDYLYANIDENIPVSKMAQMCSLSEKRFRDVFKMYTGQPPKLYYENVKMRAAKEMLSNTSFSIGDIASRLGYKNQFYFSRAFHQFYGISPNKYRTSTG